MLDTACNQRGVCNWANAGYVNSTFNELSTSGLKTGDDDIAWAIVASARTANAVKQELEPKEEAGMEEVLDVERSLSRAQEAGMPEVGDLRSNWLHG